MRNRQTDSGFEAIRIEGGLLSSELLNKLRHYQLPGQEPESYAIEPGLKLNDELGRYWRIAQSRWRRFQELKDRQDLDLQKITLDEWLLPLLTRVLGFELSASHTLRKGERSFPISHETAAGVVPMVLIGPDDDPLRQLDRGHVRFGEEGRRRSPAGLVQEYLNADEHSLWAVVSNGLRLRLYRDNPAMTRPAYVEIDLEGLFNEELFVDFTVFWLLLHASRLQPRDQRPESCLLEQWREQGQTDGERVLGELRHGVTNALRILGSGFVSHPSNTALRDAIQAGELTTEQYFQQLLRLIYRFLFLFTTEDREVLLDPQAPVEAHHLYQQGYSLSHLRDRCRQRRYHDPHDDAWQQLVITFEGFALGQPRLAQPALGGLFAADQCAELEQATLTNRDLLSALLKISYFESNRTLVRINYRDMDTEELGSVYESLLELIPQLSVETPWRFYFLGDDELGETGGHQRKLTGSYYTPDSLVQELIKSALEPVIEERLAHSPADPAQALLNITVCDPACGSGHFLLAAARRIAAELARIEAGVDQPSEADYRHALRQVVRHCIYGVDLNPLAVELCRTALWLEAIEPGKPLGFLDAHVRVGNSLVGLLTPELLEEGIPNDAYKALTGDDSQACSMLKRRNRVPRAQMQLFKTHDTNLGVCAGSISAMPEENLEQVEEKRLAWQALQAGPACLDERLRADLFTAAFFASKSGNNAINVPTNVELALLEQGESIPDAMRRQIVELAARHRFFHWFLAFPDVFDAGGFDVVLGNPPWDRIKLQEIEFFSSRSPTIARAPNAATRSRMILALQEGGPIERALYRAFTIAKRTAEAASVFMHVNGPDGGRYPLTGVGDVNTYALFAETMYQITAQHGRAGFIVPTGIATDDSTKAFFSYVSGGGRLVSLMCYENEEFIFPSVHHAFRFGLMTLRGRSETKPIKFVFFARQPSQIHDPRRCFSLTSEEFRLINPNTQTCPIFRSERDAELAKKLHRATQVLIDAEKENGNRWGISFMTMMHMSNDSHLFADEPSDGMLPLYEAKMIHQFDHRWAVYKNGESREVRPEEKALPGFEITPRYWVLESEVEQSLTAKDWDRSWLIGWRDITGVEKIRTVIATVIPRTAVGHTMPLMMTNAAPRLVTCLLANFASLVLDFAARVKVGGTHLTYGYLKQFPVLGPERYSATDLDFICGRVLELTYTSEALQPWADDLDYSGSPFAFDADRRSHLRAELDAYYARLYGLTRDELRYILDPADVMGEDYPSETFRVLKNRETNEFGEYRTQRLVLEAWDKLESGELR